MKYKLSLLPLFFFFVFDAPAMQSLAGKVSDVTVAQDQLDPSYAPEFPAHVDLQEVFEQLRDHRYLPDPEVPDHLRRIPWLYPKDGCFFRAQEMALMLIQRGLPGPGAMNVTGKISYWSPYIPEARRGKVNWVYHVALTYRYRGQLIVIDPGMENRRPLEFTEWANRIHVAGDPAKFAICSSFALGPNVNCANEKPLALNKYKVTLLKQERANLIQLNLNHEVLLGDSPPWK